MKREITAHLEKALVLLLASTFAFPFLISGWFYLSRYRSPATVWLRNVTLSGVQTPLKPPVFNSSNILNGKFQADCAGSFNNDFAGRELLIRLIDELYLRVFRISPTKVLIGRGGSLIESAYPEEYCLIRRNLNALRPLVLDLRRMQDECDARNIPFALVITPSKATIYPENLPTGWLCRYKAEPRDYDNLLLLLREQNIRYVDGHRITTELKATARAPVFPLGGVHWGDESAFATTNALLTHLATQGLPAKPIVNFETELSNDPQSQDRDLADLLNTVLPLHYPVAHITVKAANKRPDYRPNLVLVGGSFVWKMLAMLDASHQFSELEFYFYYRTSKYCQLDGELHEIASPTPPINFASDIFAADSIVLEINEETLHKPDHLSAFLHDALAAIPDPRNDKPAFHYESRIDYHWGDTLSFVRDSRSINLAATKGFADLSDIGSYTVGPVASLHFTAPTPNTDMMLEIDADAFLAYRRLPDQRVRVFANGHALGGWVWKETVTSHHELRIPAEFLGGGDVQLEFHIERPGSPAECGLGSSTDKLGIRVCSLRLCPIKD